MGHLLNNFYSYFALAVLIWFAASGQWVWLLAVIGALLVVISHNLDADLRNIAKSLDGIQRRLDSSSFRAD